MKGNYIVFEGVARAGKTTQLEKLKKHLLEEYPNKNFEFTREPGGTEIAEDIREIVQVKDYSEDMHPITEAYGYAMARAQSLRQIVKPAIDEGKIVICDRSYFSSAAIQGKARGLGLDLVLKINEVAVQEIKPDAVIYLDLDLEVTLDRESDASGDKFEKLGIEFHKLVREGYLELEKKYSDIWHTVDADGNIEEVFERIVDVVEGIIG